MESSVKCDTIIKLITMSVIIRAELFRESKLSYNICIKLCAFQFVK